MLKSKGIMVQLNTAQKRYLIDAKLFMLTSIPDYEISAHDDAIGDAVHLFKWFLGIKSTAKGLSYRICMRMPKTRSLAYCGKIILSDDQMESLMSMKEECEEMKVYDKPAAIEHRTKADRFNL